MPGDYAISDLSKNRIRTCACGFSTNDLDWFERHQDEHQHDGQQGEDYAPLDIADLADDELKQIRSGLEQSLSMPGAVASIATMAQIRAIDTELATRSALAPTFERIREDAGKTN
jgi:hypothetical protein